MTDEPFGLHVEFTARPGAGDELQAVLLEAAEGLRSAEACRLYVVSRAAGSAETVYVTEAWTSRAAHDASLEDPAARALIERAMPLLAGRPDATALRPAGGKGL